MTSNNTLERTEFHSGRAVLAMNCVLGGAAMAAVAGRSTGSLGIMRARDWTRSAGVMYIVFGVFVICVAVIGAGGMSWRSVWASATSLEGPNVVMVLAGLIAFSLGFGGFLLASGRASFAITAVGVIGIALAFAWGYVAACIWAVPALMLWRGEDLKKHDA